MIEFDELFEEILKKYKESLNRRYSSVSVDTDTMRVIAYSIFDRLKDNYIEHNIDKNNLVSDILDELINVEKEFLRR